MKVVETANALLLQLDIYPTNMQFFPNLFNQEFGVFVFKIFTSLYFIL
jgi:hypothetical protein